MIDRRSDAAVGRKRVGIYRAHSQYGLSVSSVKVVRHRWRISFCGRLWKRLWCIVELPALSNLGVPSAAPLIVAHFATLGWGF